jgi:hypothetical protein
MLLIVVLPVHVVRRPTPVCVVFVVPSHSHCQSVPLSPPMSSGLQVGCVMWQPQVVVVKKRDPLRPCEQRLTAAAMDAERVWRCGWVGDIISNKQVPKKEKE